MEKLDIEKKFGLTIRKWREKVHISQEQLAKRAGLHRTYVCDVERGARNISLKNVEKLANALDVPLLTFFADLSPAPPSTTPRADELVDILLVEDSASDITLTMESFRTWKMTNHVYVVGDGASALDFLFGTGEFAHRRPTDLPQIILLDVNLPEIGGMEVLRRIKGDVRTSSIPVVMLTGSKDERDMAECKRLGVADYIHKPVTFQSFSEVSLRLNLQWALFRR